MPHIPNPKKRNYLHQLLNIVQGVGSLTNSVQCNLHKYNFVHPDDLECKVEELKENLDLFLRHYTEEYKQSTLDMEH